VGGVRRARHQIVATLDDLHRRATPASNLVGRQRRDGRRSLSWPAPRRC
jgi:hypothetical protein